MTCCFSSSGLFTSAWRDQLLSVLLAGRRHDTIQLLELWIESGAGLHRRENDREAGVRMGARALAVVAGDYWAAGDFDCRVVDCGQARPEARDKTATRPRGGRGF